MNIQPMKRLSLLGSTGSIGCQTLDVVARHPDKLSVCSLAAGKSNLNLLIDQIKQFHPELVAVPDRESAKVLKNHFSGEIIHGENALAQAVHPQATHVVVAVVGSLGLVPTLNALESGKTVALANKETLVAGGHLVKQALEKHGGALIPVDSEHSAIFQCLGGERPQDAARLWLTASGGPFRGFTAAQLKQVSKAQVLAHPVWKMGNKITVDSASLMNKGLEVIEAKWLFDFSPDHISVVVHPQGIIHSMVEFVDGSMIAQLGLPDMKTPIQLALSFPERWASPPPQLNPFELKPLTFEAPDKKTFPLLQYAYDAAQAGGTMPAVLNAANEEAVHLFLQDKIHFSEIPNLVFQALSKHSNKTSPLLQDVLEADAWARQQVLHKQKETAGATR